MFFKFPEPPFPCQKGRCLAMWWISHMCIYCTVVSSCHNCVSYLTPCYDIYGKQHLHLHGFGLHFSPSCPSAIYLSRVIHPSISMHVNKKVHVGLSRAFVCFDAEISTPCWNVTSSLPQILWHYVLYNNIYINISLNNCFVSYPVVSLLSP